MRTMRSFHTLAIVFLSSSVVAQTIEIRDEFKHYFNEANVKGSFSFYDSKNDKYILCNEKQFTQEFLPASTFKICNSLIGLETGVIPDDNFVIQWDGKKRRIESWNADQDLKTAYKNSCVPYYQELARRIGGERMSEWLEKTKYGNTDTSGGIDLFWLTGGLRVTPEQQLDFLKRLHNEELSFSKRSMQIVKKIMIEEEKPMYTLRAKTGWASAVDYRDDNFGDVGWYIGYITTTDNIFFFATCIQSSKPSDDFPKSRKTITRKILSDLLILGDKE